LEITNLVVHSFTFNFVKLLNLIVWDSEHKAFCNFLSNTISRPSGWAPRSKTGRWRYRLKRNILGFQGAVSLMFLSKTLLFMTFNYQRKMYKNTSGVEMGPDPTRPDPTRACFWPAVNKRPTRLWPRYFPTRPEAIFFDPKVKNWKIWRF